MTTVEIEAWLREDDPVRLEELWAWADRVRREHVGDEVHLRGLVEISNYCVRSCAYCGLRAGNRRLTRYRMTAEEVLACARQAVAYGYGTVVLQSGEDYGMTRDWLADLIRRIKAETTLAVTLSLGERPEADLAAWREAGADRYLLRFETSDRALYDRLHPPRPGQARSDRLALLDRLRELGYEVGSGVMIGIPGQTYASLARDVALFRELDLDMVGVGPWIAHPQTPLGGKSRVTGRESRVATEQARAWLPGLPQWEQVPNTEEMTYKVIALTRIVCPEANIPSTTALATVNQASGRELALARGANVVMPNLTPPRYQALYEIYPGKACLAETAEAGHRRLLEQIRRLGRTVGKGSGSRRKRASVFLRDT